MSRKRHIGAFLLEENIGKMVLVKNSEYLYNIICFTLKGEENHETTKTALRPIADAVRIPRKRRVGFNLCSKIEEQADSLNRIGKAGMKWQRYLM